MSLVNRRAFLGMAGIAGLAMMGGCSGESNGSQSGEQKSQRGAESAQDASQSTEGSAASNSVAGTSLTVGTLATEDILPLWVAAAEGLNDAQNLDVNIITFQSATELISGISSGEVDLAMTDIMVTASIFASGTDVQMQWVTLGTEPSQGRFGIMAGPTSEINELSDLAGVPIGVGSNTILEYVMDKLLESAGVVEGDIVVEELQKLPVRYQAMASGDVAAAALPGTLLALGEANDCKLIADDTQGENLSQSVMIVRAELLSDANCTQAIEVLEDIWDEAAGLINANPEAYRTVLVENANLPEEISKTYPISTYPTVQLPSSTMVDPVLDWMEHKGYLTKTLAYDEATGTFSVKS